MKLILLLVSLLGILNVQAQFVYEQGVDLLVSSYGWNHGVIPAGKRGLVLINEINDASLINTRKWELLQLDTNLKLQLRTYFESASNLRISQVKAKGDHLYLLFQDTELPAKRVAFARASLASDKFYIFEVQEFVPREIIGFEVLGESMFLIGLDEDRPVILRYRFGDPRPRVLQGLFGEHNELLKTEVLASGDRIQIIARMKRQRGSLGMILVKHFDEEGNVVRKIVIESSKGHNLLSAVASTDSLGNTCVIGTYTYNKSKSSTGIFSTIFDDDGEHEVYYYDYTNLHNFFHHLPAKERTRMQLKYQPGNSRKKYKSNFDLRQLTSHGNGWIAVGEAIKFSEKSLSSSGYMWPIEHRKYSHALIFGIGSDGRLQWDNSMSMKGLENSLNIQQVHTYPVNGTHIMYYYDGVDLVYSLIDRGAEAPALQHYYLDESRQEIKNKEKPKGGNILPWFDGTFLIFGSYTITPKFGVTRNNISLEKVTIDLSNNTNTP